MKMTILTHRCFWGKTHLFDFVMKSDTDKEWAKKMIDKLYTKRYFDPDKASGELTFIEIPKPNSWPKFDNEHPFRVSWDGKYINNPKINAIRWGVEGWEYQLQSIGHIHDYQPERKLELIISNQQKEQQ